MQFLVVLFALATVATARNIVFKGDHGYHEQSFNIQSGGSSGGGLGGLSRSSSYGGGSYGGGSVVSSRRSVGSAYGGGLALGGGGLALGGAQNVQLVALIPVGGAQQSHAVASHSVRSSAQSSGPIYAAVQVGFGQSLLLNNWF